ncbi:hypothetical protein DFJ74DRAFT_672069 [Hyaloraphidium curvatum]|nr:hypothetical protein DFJ74DRAFT_672069 [Hyaloraphidium curvatum]
MSSDASSCCSAPDGGGPDGAPRLPPELLLEIASYLRPRDLLEASLASRTVHQLLLSELVGSLSDRWFSTRGRVEAFARDAVGAGKFGAMKRWRLSVRERTDWILEAGILPRCRNLVSLALNVTLPGQLEMVASAGLLALKELELNVLQAFDLPEGFALRLPALEELEYSCILIPGLLDAIVAGCPALTEAKMEVYPISQAAVPSPLLPRTLLGRVKSWHMTNFDWFSLLLQEPDFDPETVTQWAALRMWDSADAFSLLRGKKRLRRLEVAGIGTHELVGGLPEGLESFSAEEVRLSRLSREDLAKLEAALADSGADISIQLRWTGGEALAMEPDEFRDVVAQLGMWKWFGTGRWLGTRRVQLDTDSFGGGLAEFAAAYADSLADAGDEKIEAFLHLLKAATGGATDDDASEEEEDVSTCRQLR